VQSTADGGATWQEALMFGLGSADRMHFWDPVHGMALVELSNGPAPAAGMLRTTDGGRTWAPVLPATTP